MNSAWANADLQRIHAELEAMKEAAPGHYYEHGSLTRAICAVQDADEAIARRQGEAA